MNLDGFAAKRLVQSLASFVYKVGIKGYCNNKNNQI